MVDSQDFAADLRALRDEMAKLSTFIAEFIHSQTDAAADTVVGAVDNTRQTISDVASKAQDRVAGVGTDVGTAIERNPLAAVLVAVVVGIAVGMLSPWRK